MYEAVKKIFLLFEDGDMWQVPGICISEIKPSRDSYYVIDKYGTYEVDCVKEK